MQGFRKIKSYLINRGDEPKIIYFSHYFPM